MDIRPARMDDIPAMAELINYHAERGRMLHRSLAYLYERVRNFSVCQTAEQIVGCCALEPVWSGLAELKSLAVREDLRGQSIGKALVRASIETGRELAVKQVFCLTREPEFFKALGFSQIDRQQLPHKVWSDCVSCPLKDNCDEVALILGI